MADSFRDQVVVITGASSGIGRELALQLAAEGARLALASRNARALEQVARECSARSGQAIAVAADVSEPLACRNLIDTTVRTYGRLDMLLNNAGISMYARFADIRDPLMLDRIMRVNFHSAVNCTSHALPYLAQTHGRIVAVSSLSGKIVSPGASGYAASKFALRGFFDSLRVELRCEKVSVTVAYPGFVRTEIFQRFLDAEGNHGPDWSVHIPRWAMMPVQRCARRVLEAARRRRREVPPTVLERLILVACRWTPRLVDRFWQRTLRKHFPRGSPTAPGKGSAPGARLDNNFGLEQSGAME